jgi:hypothetical protein
MKKIFYLLTVIAAMFAITSCDKNGNSTTPTSPDDLKSGIEGTWVAVDTFFYNNSQWQQVTGRDIAMSDKETGYNAVYIFRQGKMSALAYNGILDGDDFLYIKEDDTSAPIGVAVDYWMEDGLFYTSLSPEGRSITYFDNKHMQIEGGYLLRKVDNLKQAPQENPLRNTYWTECDFDSNNSSIDVEGYSFTKFEEDGKHLFRSVVVKIDGVWYRGENEKMMYIYAPNNKEVYFLYETSKNMYRVSLDAVQMLQENESIYLVDAWEYKYGNEIRRKYIKIDGTLIESIIESATPIENINI